MLSFTARTLRCSYSWTIVLKSRALKKSNLDHMHFLNGQKSKLGLRTYNDINNDIWTSFSSKACCRLSLNDIFLVKKLDVVYLKNNTLFMFLTEAEAVKFTACISFERIVLPPNFNLNFLITPYYLSFLVDKYLKNHLIYINWYLKILLIQFFIFGTNQIVKSQIWTKCIFWTVKSQRAKTLTTYF